MHQPETNDVNFQTKIAKIYKKFRTKKQRKTIDDYCGEGKFFFQTPQEFLQEFLEPKSRYKSVLVYHKVGSGKTCSAVRIAEKWLESGRRVIVITPASLRENFMRELRGKCGNEKYMSEKDISRLKVLNPESEEYAKIISTSDTKILKKYEIYSFSKFFGESRSLDRCLLIVDEVHHLVSKTGTRYKALHSMIHSAKDLKVVLLSATPIVDRPEEIALTMNLLVPNPSLPTGNDFEKTFIAKKRVGGVTKQVMINKELFHEMISGYVSYYGDAPSFAFPKLKMKTVRCQMSDFQYRAYCGARNGGGDPSFVSGLPNNFLLGERLIANIAFPNNRNGGAGLSSLTNSKILSDLSTYSCKFAAILRRVRRLGQGKVFVFTCFRNEYGVLSVAKILTANGYKNFLEHGTGKKRFAILSGLESPAQKSMIKRVLNSDDNLRGGKLKIIIGSTAAGTGVNLTAIKQIHLADPGWNVSTNRQRRGRGFRLCSHYLLPEDERDIVVYAYTANHPEIKISVDQHIINMSKSKYRLEREFCEVIKLAAIDRLL